MKKRTGVWFLLLYIVFISGCSSKPQEISFTEVDVTDRATIYVDQENCGYMSSLTSSASRHHHLPIEITSEDTELVYYFHVEDGGLTIWDPQSLTETAAAPEQTIQVKNGEYIQWRESCIRDDNYVFFYQGVTWADVRIEKEGNIVGYAVLRLELKESGKPLGEVVKQAEFPLIGGEYQPVTVEYVESQIEKVKQQLTAGDTEAETGNTEETETIDASSVVWTEIDSGISMAGSWIELNAADEEVEYWFTIDDGILLLEGESAPSYAWEGDIDGYHEPRVCSGSVSLRTSTGIFLFEGTRYYRRWQGERTYVNVVMYKEGHIVGYAVLERYYKRESGIDVSLTLLEQIGFPQVDGEYQDISEAYVWAEIAKVKEGQ